MEIDLHLRSETTMKKYNIGEKKEIFIFFIYQMFHRGKEKSLMSINNNGGFKVLHLLLRICCGKVLSRVDLLQGLWDLLPRFPSRPPLLYCLLFSRWLLSSMLQLASKSWMLQRIINFTSLRGRNNVIIKSNEHQNEIRYAQFSRNFNGFLLST